MFPVFLIQIVVALLVVGLILWLLTLIPGIDPSIMQVIRAVVIIVMVIWIIYALLGVGSAGFGPRPLLR